MNNETSQQTAKSIYEQCHDGYLNGLLTTEEAIKLYERKWNELIELQRYGQPQQQPVAAR